MATRLPDVEIEDETDFATESAPPVRGGFLDAIDLVDDDDNPVDARELPTAAQIKARGGSGTLPGAGSGPGAYARAASKKKFAREPKESALETFANPRKVRSAYAPPPEPPRDNIARGGPSEFEFDDFGGDGMGDDGGYDDEDEFDDDGDEYYEEVRPSAKEIHSRKVDLLHKMHRMKEKGISVGDFTMRSDLDEMQFEYDKVMHALEVRNAIQTMRQILIAGTSAAQFLNSRYDPFGLKLDGWSESVMSNVSDYDNVFERLYEKHKNRVSVAPEIQLMFMLGGSAMMFHMSASFANSGLPSMSEIAKTDPELMKSLLKVMMARSDGQGSLPRPPPIPPSSNHPLSAPVDNGPDGARAQAPYVMRGPSLGGFSMGSAMPSVPVAPRVPSMQRPDMDQLVQDAMSSTPRPEMAVVDILDDDGESVADSYSGGAFDAANGTGVAPGEVRTVQVTDKKKRRGGNKKKDVDANKLVLDL